MSSTPQTAEFWALKAHALLLPTPLAPPGTEPFADRNTDPEESARADDLCDLLAKHGLEVAFNEDLRKLLRDAHVDAYYAHVPADADATSTDQTQYRGLRHPLSGEELGAPRSTDKNTWNAFVKHLDMILANAGEDTKEKYKALWRALIDPKNDLLDLAKRPGHPIFNDHSIIARRSAASALVGARCGGHKAALLCLHTGPVQGFIAHARRTHDLALGSYIVAYLSFQAIQSLADRWGPDAILYPHLATLALYDYTPGDLKRAQQALRASLPNRFMAIVADDEADESAKQAAGAVANGWKEIAGSVRAELKSLYPGELFDRPAGAVGSHIDSNLYPGELFDRQIADHLQLDATIRPWARTAAGHSDYESGFRGTRDDLTAQRRLLTALPITAPKPGDPPAYKCTQCGDREQLGSGPEFWDKLREALKEYFSNGGRKSANSNTQNPADESGESIDLRAGEALCAVCLTKRFANRWYFGNPEKRLGLDWRKADTDRLLLRFPSVASIASAPLRYALEQQSATIDLSDWFKAVDRCQDDLKFTPPGNLLPGLGGPQRTKSHLDLDGTWYYETSYDPETALRDHDLDPRSEGGDKATAKKLEETLPDALDKLKKALKNLARKSSPSQQSGGVHVTPYYAVIVLDVDRMGKWLDGKHPRSLKRTQFLSTIERGDDRRTITPALHREISRRQSELTSDPIYTIVERNHLGRVIYGGGDDLLAFVPLDTLWRCLDDLRSLFCSPQGLGQEVTLSAGIAISHWRAPLSRALSLARRAESEAKDSGRDRLIVKVDRRSGSELVLPLAWPLVKHLCDLSVLADLSEDATANAENDDTNRRLKIRLNSLETLERELETLCSFESPALAEKAVRTRVALHLTTRLSSINRSNHPDRLLTTLLDSKVKKLKTGESIAAITLPDKSDPPVHIVPLVPLVPLLRLLRFLARERDPAIADASSSKSKEIT